MTKRGVRENASKFIGIVTLLGCALLLTVLGVAATHSNSSAWKKGAAKTATPVAAAKTKPASRWAEAYGKLPLSFEENRGQTAREVRFVSHGHGYELFLTSQEAVLALRAPSPAHLDFSPRHRTAYLRAIREKRLAAPPTTAIRMQLAGANPAPQISGADRLPTRVNYFSGSDPKNWHTDIPAYARVKYEGVYPGVDLIFYGNQRRLEYDFVVAPGADPGAIQLRIDGARKMSLDAQGNLILRVPGGETTLQKPLIYQEVNGEKREIKGKFVLARGHRLSFSVANYDRTAPLILDPVLLYSTYLGGGAGENPSLPVGIAVDSAGNAFVAGQTFSVDFPTTISGIGGNANPNPNAGASFVSELNPAGTQLLYSAYLVGTTTNLGDGATAVAVDSTGKVYVTGVTFAAGFPSKNPLPPAANTVGGICYVTKLDPTQTVAANSLLFSTYLGGTVAEICNAIAVDANANAYVAGFTTSTDFPVSAGAFQSTFNGANVNNASGSAFLSRIDTTTSTLVYSTYLSGNAANAATSTLGFGDQAFGVAADASNNAYIVGTTTSNNPSGFPSSPNANQTALPVTNVVGSAFVSRVNTAGSGAASLVYSTYLAGSTEDQGFGIALGPTNLAFVTGAADSNDFPFTTGAFDTSGTGAGKAFVTVVDTTNTMANANSPFHYSTPLGGGGGDTGYGIKVDGNGNAYVVGTSGSANFPLTPGPLQSARLNPTGDVFIAKLFPGGTGTADLLYSTYFGGSGPAAPLTPAADQGFAIAIDSANPPNAYITGQTSSTDIPILSPLPGGNALKGPSDAFVAKLALIPTLSVTPSPSFDFGVQPVGVTSTAQQFTVTNNTASAAPFASIVVTGVTPAANTDFKISNDACSPSLAAATQCTVSITFTPSTAAAESATLVITATVTNGGQNSNIVLNVTLNGTGSSSAPGVGFAPTSLSFGNQAVGTTSAAMPVTLTNTGNAALTINTITVTGTNAGDFAATSTGGTACPISPSTLAAGANCTINVTFTPSATGARAGTLSVSDNAGGSPHTVPLSGTGTNPADFTLSAAPAAENVTAGAVAAPVTISVNPTNGFASAVALTCTGAPANSSCVLSPASITAPTTSTLTFTAHAMFVPPPVSRPPSAPLNPLRIVPLFVALLLLLLLRWTQRFRVRLAMVSAILACLTLAACSSPPGPNNNTQKGVYPLTVKGTSGALSHTTTVTITVN